MDKIEILVVDDAESIRLYMREILAKLDVNVTEAEDGIQAFKLIANNVYDLIFMDIEMPGKSGLDVIERVRTQLDYKYTPIIVMTGLQQPELIKKAFEIGASDYIAKPLTEVEVFARLKTRLENRRLHRELREATKLAEKSNHAKSEFMTRLAHELKAPLNAIHGYAEIIQMQIESGDNASILKSCSIIRDAAKHQESLINEVTNLAKIEAGIMDIDLIEVELSQVIKEVFHLTQPMADEFKVKLKLPRLAEVKYTIKADRKRLKQVFLNLISNAIKYNKSKGVVSIDVRKSTDGYIKIGISDTGIGIADNDIHKIFEIFNRLDAEKAGIDGLGIGLPITKKIIELMGGNIEVESTKGKGSTFWIYLKGSKIAA